MWNSFMNDEMRIKWIAENQKHFGTTGVHVSIIHHFNGASYIFSPQNGGNAVLLQSTKVHCSTFIFSGLMVGWVEAMAQITWATFYSLLVIRQNPIIMSILVDIWKWFWCGAQWFWFNVKFVGYKTYLNVAYSYTLVSLNVHLLQKCELMRYETLDVIQCET